MTDRVEVYLGEVPSITDILLSNKYPYVGVGRLTDAILGSDVQMNGFACTPQEPTADLTANIDIGEIYIQKPVDTTQYVNQPIDNTFIQKQGIFPTKTSFSFPAPTIPGDAINYLVQVGFLESDINITARPYYNTASTPTAPLPPIVLSNTSTRNDAAIVSVKTGTSAPEGTQVTPTPDAGSEGAWVVTVEYGQTQIISANINAYPDAPFITEKLKDKISEATGDARYVQLNTSNPFKAHQGSVQTISPGIEVALNIDTVDFGSGINTVTHRFQPTVEGYYKLEGSVYGLSNPINGFIFSSGALVGLKLNGTTYLSFIQCTNDDNSLSGPISSRVFLNGTTDYVELVFSHDFPVLVEIQPDYYTTFSGEKSN